MAFFRSTREMPPGSVQQRELFAFGLYRVFEAVLLALLAFAPGALEAFGPLLPGLLQAVAATYLASSLLLLVLGRRPGADVLLLGGCGLALDIAAAATVMATQEPLDTAVGLMLLFNITIGSLVVGPRLAFALALLAATALFGEYTLSQFATGIERSLLEPVMFSAGYVAAAMLSQFLRQELARSEALADARGSEVERLAEINELVIRRMRTGVLVVDGEHRVRVFNEAAWALLGARGEAQGLAELNPRLDVLLRRWRAGDQAAPPPLRAVEDGPELLPRFAAIGRQEELFLVFLEDSRVYSGRAEALTLATLGRLGASIAHEIRNPLAAILHAAQLLQESPDLPPTDRRLLEIILGQCGRMDGIVDSVLGLARRERAQAEVLPLPARLHRFAQDYATTHPPGNDQVRVAEGPALAAIADPRHLQQVLTVLVDNARAYGRLPGEPARIHLRAQPGAEGASGSVEIDVIDHGPGIAPAIAARLFEPFFTTSEHGTGLGLYIARQLAEANQGSLQYLPVPGGGACFRLRLPGRPDGVEGALR